MIQHNGCLCGQSTAEGTQTKLLPEEVSLALELKWVQLFQTFISHDMFITRTSAATPPERDEPQKLLLGVHVVACSQPLSPSQCNNKMVVKSQIRRIKTGF